MVEYSENDVVYSEDEMEHSLDEIEYSTGDKAEQPAKPPLEEKTELPRKKLAGREQADAQF